MLDRVPEAFETLTQYEVVLVIGGVVAAARDPRVDPTADPGAAGERVSARARRALDLRPRRYGRLHAARAGLRVLPADDARLELRVLLAERPASEVPAAAKELAAQHGATLRAVWPNLHAFSLEIDERAARRLSEDARVQAVEQVRQTRLSYEQNTRLDPACPTCGNTQDNRQWHLDRLDQDSPELDESIPTAPAART